MSNKLTLIYDCPLEGCDKIWLYNELKMRTTSIDVICPRKKLSKLRIGNTFDKAFFIIYLIEEYIRVLFSIRRTDIFIIWDSFLAVIVNFFCCTFAPNRIIVSFNWLTPNRNSRIKSLIRKALNNKRFVAIVNSEESIEKYKEIYGLQHTDNLLCLPDTFDTQEEFDINNDKPINSDYFFTGGINNRDYELVFQVAKEIPNYKFIVVALKEHWEYKEKNIPNNVEVLFNISHEQYYSLMRNAKAVLLPLKDNRVAGLINICKSIQFGVICVTTKTPATKIYYDSESNDYLIDIGSDSQLISIIKRISSYPPEIYHKEIVKMQRHIINTVSPATIIDRLIDYCKSHYPKDFISIFVKE